MAQVEFGEVRSILQRPPGAQTWLALAEALRGLTPKSYPEEVKTYIESSLAHDWPKHELRWNQSDWVRTGRGKFVHPDWAIAMQYCDAIDLSERDLDNKRMRSLIKKDYDWSGTRAINFSCNMISRSGISEFIDAMDASSLELLDMRQNYFSLGMVEDYERLLDKAPNMQRIILEDAYYEGMTGKAAQKLEELARRFNVTIDV